jgi:hypothetical protein
MLQGAQYADAMKGAMPVVDAGKPARDYAHASGVSHGIGKSIELIGSLASHADPVQTGKPEHKLSEEEKVFNSWKP